MIALPHLGVRDGLLLALTLVAGAVDAVSYLGLRRVFTGNMTANLVLLGLAVGPRPDARGVRSVVALLGFAAGAMVGGWVVGAGQGGEVWPSRVTVVLAVELGLLAVLQVAWALAGSQPPSGELEVLIAISVAMGVQSVAGRRLAVANFDNVRHGHTDHAHGRDRCTGTPATRRSPLDWCPGSADRRRDGRGHPEWSSHDPARRCYRCSFWAA